MDSNDGISSPASSSVSEDNTASTFMGRFRTISQMNHELILRRGYENMKRIDEDLQQYHQKYHPYYQQENDVVKDVVQQHYRKHQPGERDWRTDETELLVKLWSEKEELFNTNHPFYLDRAKKSQILKEFAAKLNCTEIEIKRKMRNLQSYYSQIKRESLNIKGTSNMKKTKWTYFDMLKFLDDHSVSRSLSTPNEVNYPVDYVSSSSNVPLNDIKPKVEENILPRLRTPSPLDVPSRRTHSYMDSHEKPCYKGYRTEDNIFGDLVAMKISKIGDDDIKEELKIEILQSILAAKRKVASHII